MRKKLTIDHKTSLAHFHETFQIEWQENNNDLDNHELGNNKINHSEHQDYELIMTIMFIALFYVLQCSPN